MRNGIGTGADTTQVIKEEGPSLLRTFFIGAAFTAGGLLVAGIAKGIKDLVTGRGDEYDSKLDEVDEVSGYSPRDVIEAHDLKASRAQKKRVEQLAAEDDEDDY